MIAPTTLRMCPGTQEPSCPLLYFQSFIVELINLLDRLINMGPYPPPVTYGLRRCHLIQGLLPFAKKNSLKKNENYHSCVIWSGSSFLPFILWFADNSWPGGKNHASDWGCSTRWQYNILSKAFRCKDFSPPPAHCSLFAMYWCLVMIYLCLDISWRSPSFFGAHKLASFTKGSK